jgi:hypothetical protein
MRWQSWTLIGILLAWALPVQAQQTIYWKKDRIQDDRGLTIATATPLPSDQTAPSAPTGLTYSNVTTNSARLDWSGSTDTGGSQLAGYKVYRGNLPVAAVSGTSFTDYELTPLASYTYTIVAFDKAGNHSSASSSVS